MSGLVDPMPPAEGDGGLKAKDLKNKPLIVLPKRRGTEKGTQPDDNGDIKDWDYVECDVWVLDRMGVEESGKGVRFSWWKVLPGLESQIGLYVGVRPRQENNGNAVIFEPLTGSAREVAAKVVAELQAASGAVAPDPSEAPFTEGEIL